MLYEALRGNLCTENDLIHSNVRSPELVSPPCAQAVGGKLCGVKLVVIDEISMIDFETLYEISLRHSKSMGTTVTDKIERSNMECLYFGGTHVLFTGDFYQTKANNFSSYPRLWVGVPLPEAPSSRYWSSNNLNIEVATFHILSSTIRNTIACVHSQLSVNL